MFPFSVFTVQDSTTFEGSFVSHSMYSGLKSIEKEITGLYSYNQPPPLFSRSALSRSTFSVPHLLKPRLP